MSPSNLPSWRLPDGVTRSLWQYAQAPHIANDYDEYFQGNSLFDFDTAFVARHFTRNGAETKGTTPQQTVADLGCGTGRSLVPLARQGFRGLAVDLSAHMLAVVGYKAAAEGLAIDRVLANMVELDCLADESIDHVMCMFSTLGMVRTHAARMQVLGHAHRMLKPGGTFVLHVHNRWYNALVPQGRQWLLSNLLRWIAGHDTEPGDKFFDYRGIPQMYLHVFTRRELVGMLRAAGFSIVEIAPLDTSADTGFVTHGG